MSEKVQKQVCKCTYDEKSPFVTLESQRWVITAALIFLSWWWPPLKKLIMWVFSGVTAVATCEADVLHFGCYSQMETRGALQLTLTDYIFNLWRKWSPLIDDVVVSSKENKGHRVIGTVICLLLCLRPKTRFYKNVAPLQLLNGRRSSTFSTRHESESLRN